MKTLFIILILLTGFGVNIVYAEKTDGGFGTKKSSLKSVGYPPHRH